MPTMNQHLIGQEIYLDPEISKKLKMPFRSNSNVMILPAAIIKDNKPLEDFEAVTFSILLACGNNYLQLRGTKYPGYWTLEGLRPNTCGYVKIERG